MGERLFSTREGIHCLRCDLFVLESAKYCSRCGALMDREVTNIKIKMKVLGKLAKRKKFDKESHSDVIQRLLKQTESSKNSISPSTTQPKRKEIISMVDHYGPIKKEDSGIRIKKIKETI